MWESRRLTTLWVSTACYKDNFTFLQIILVGKHRVFSDLNTTLKVRGQHQGQAAFTAEDSERRRE
jgi:hypothetical protein